jgi:hypothetical protein
VIRGLLARSRFLFRVVWCDFAVTGFKTLTTKSHEKTPKKSTKKDLEFRVRAAFPTNRFTFAAFSDSIKCVVSDKSSNVFFAITFGRAWGVPS